jgi:hypothetical protein
MVSRIRPLDAGAPRRRRLADFEELRADDRQEPLVREVSPGPDLRQQLDVFRQDLVQAEPVSRCSRRSRIASACASDSRYAPA